LIKASVVIPIRNCAGTIGTVLHSLDSQNYPKDNFEVVAVDNESTDTTSEIIKQYKAEYKLIHLYSVPSHTRWNPSKVRNQGLNHARGNIVIFLDADVIPGPDFISSHVEIHEREPVPQGIFGYMYGYPWLAERRTPEILCPPPVTEILDNLQEFVAANPDDWQDGRIFHKYLWPWQFFWSANISVKREVACTVGGFDENFRGWGWEDIEFGFRLSAKGVKLFFSHEAWGIHYPHPARLEGKTGDEMKNVLYILKKHQDPRLEISCWFLVNGLSGRENITLCREIKAVLDKPPVLPALSLNMINTLMHTLKMNPGEKIMIIGQVAEKGMRRIKVDLWSQPFQSGIEAVQSRMLCLFMPYSDSSFNDILLIDYWRFFSPTIIGLIIKEASRISKRVILAASENINPETPGNNMQDPFNDIIKEGKQHQILQMEDLKILILNIV
jgi:glycosyltransferase involved in cell wall biosynthesis